MEDEERPFQPVQVGMVSVETGRERFIRDGEGVIPQPTYWRLNLTALSQKYNIYFVAMGSYVHLYKPKFPFQTIGRRPEIFLLPRLCNEQAPGYINLAYPHHINNLIIGQLGEQEVLLISTDNGNVTGYATKPFYNSIRSREANPNASESSTNTVFRPFFTQWVTESAWGLSIHRDARMIAVSANASPRHGMGDGQYRGSVTVFAFALTTEEILGDIDTSTRSDSDTSDTNQEWQTWYPTTMNPTVTRPNRNKNYKIVLAGHNGHPTNIPHVSFINTQEDRDGCWLLSTDIDENVKLWQIWTGMCVRTWKFRGDYMHGAAWMGVTERGWLATALDKRAFLPVDKMESLIGYVRAPQHYGYHAQGDSFDITNVVRYHVPSNSLHHPLFPSETEEDNESSSEADLQVVEDLSDFESSDGEADIDQFNRIQTPSDYTVPCLPEIPDGYRMTDMDFDAETTHPWHNFGHVPEYSSDDDDDSFVVRSDFSEGNISDHEVSNELLTGRESGILVSDGSGDHNSGNGLQRGRSRLHTRIPQDGDLDLSNSSINPVSRADGAKADGSMEIPDVPFVYCSTSHLRLFGSMHSQSPHLFCARMLRQVVNVEMEDQGIFQLDRLDMVEQIPELGIVIIATQVGRCAICSLTKRRGDNLLAIRVDWVVPTEKQEHAGCRPNSTLHGIAVSPIQGRYPSPSASHGPTTKLWVRDHIVDGISTMFDPATADTSNQDQHFPKTRSKSTENFPSKTPPLRHRNYEKAKNFEWTTGQAPEPWRSVEGKRRYRLMLTYADMTVLTYEISRGVEREDRAQ